MAWILLDILEDLLGEGPQNQESQNRREHISQLQLLSPEWERSSPWTNWCVHRERVNLSDKDLFTKCWHTMVIEQAWVRISFPATLISSESIGWVCSYRNSALLIPKRKQIKAIILNFFISIAIVLTMTAIHDLQYSSVLYCFNIWISLIKYACTTQRKSYLISLL